MEDILFGVTAAFERASRKYELRFSMDEFLSMYGTESDHGYASALIAVEMDDYSM